MKYPDRPWLHGEIPERLESEDSVMEEREYIISGTSNENLDQLRNQTRKRSAISMQESAHPNNLQTLRDRLNVSKRVIRTTKLSKTSDPDSTTNERTLKPFWDASTLEMSRRLLSPTGIDSVGTDLNSSNLSANTTARKSWSITNQKQRDSNRNSLKISWPSAISSSRGTMGTEEADLKSIKDVRARKIKLNPSSEWKERLTKWMGTSRWTYNRCLDFYKRGKCKLSRKDFRSKIVGGWNHGDTKKGSGKKKKKKRGKKRGNWCKPKKTSKRASTTSWVLETPFEIRDSAMVDLYRSFDTNFKIKKKNPSHTFEIKFRSRKDVQVIKIPGSVIKNGYIFKSFCGKDKLKGFENWSSFMGEVVIQKDRIGNFYACVTEQSELTPPNVGDPSDLKVVALDPGVRTFNTAVDTKGVVTEFAPNDVGRIYRMCHHMDKLQSRAFDKSIPSKRRYNLRKGWHRAIKRVKDLVQDVRNKTVKHLVTNYDVIFLPEFNTKQMVNRAKRRIDKGTARGMMTWSHYSFKELLKTTALREGVKLVIVTEEYTSKTCSCCGFIHKKLGKSKVFDCPSCRVVMDRDENGARNILLKSCVENELTLSWVDYVNNSTLQAPARALGPTPGFT